jgi:dCMP deaminase
MIIGLTGTLASGKGVVSEFLKKQGFVYLSLSDELREISKEIKIELTRENLQNLGNKLREENGAGVLARLVIKKIQDRGYNKAIVDGIRNPTEVAELRKVKEFFLVSVDAPPEIRFKRIVERNRENDPKIWEDFLKVDMRDQGEADERGQQVRKCMNLSDFQLINNAPLEIVQKMVEEMYEKLLSRIPRPSWDEYFMEISRAVAKRATCNRGKSGCVIVRDKQILVTGYVGSPVGLSHCDEVGHQMKTVRHEDGSETRHCVRTAHAEQNAICQAAKLGVSLNGSTLYCKMTPCSTCAKMIINSGIKKVVAEMDYHVAAETKDMFRVAGIWLVILNEQIEKYKDMGKAEELIKTETPMAGSENKITREFLSTVYIVKDGKVLLTFNKVIKKFIPVGGHIEPNELPDASVIREAKEESGYDIELVDFSNFKSETP